jgi:hypothetical protein
VTVANTAPAGGSHKDGTNNLTWAVLYRLSDDRPLETVVSENFTEESENVHSKIKKEAPYVHIGVEEEFR